MTETTATRRGLWPAALIALWALALLTWPALAFIAPGVEAGTVHVAGLQFTSLNNIGAIVFLAGVPVAMAVTVARLLFAGIPRQSVWGVVWRVAMAGVAAFGAYISVMFLALLLFPLLGPGA